MIFPIDSPIYNEQASICASWHDWQALFNADSSEQRVLLQELQQSNNDWYNNLQKVPIAVTTYP